MIELDVGLQYDIVAQLCQPPEPVSRPGCLAEIFPLNGLTLPPRTGLREGGLKMLPHRTIHI